MSTTGKLYGIGIGPGDPELLTLKAWRLLSTVEVVAYPEPENGGSMARGIAAPFIPEEVIELPVTVPMTVDREPARNAYDQATIAITRHLNEGRHVAFLCEGDPFLYGSFMYLHQRMSRSHDVVVVPGVTSLTASAAALGRPLAARNDILKILPAPLPADRLESEIRDTEAVAIIKVGKHFDKIKGIIAGLGLTGNAAIIESATGDRERITPLEELPEGERPYFSTILIYKGDERW